MAGAGKALAMLVEALTQLTQPLGGLVVDFPNRFSDQCRQAIHLVLCVLQVFLAALQVTSEFGFSLLEQRHALHGALKLIVLAGSLSAFVIEISEQGSQVVYGLEWTHRFESGGELV